MKTCTRCRQELPLTNFYRRRRATDGLAYECKRCKDAATRTYKESLTLVAGHIRNRSLSVTDVGRRALQEEEDAEARRKAMEFLFAPFKWQRPRLADAA